LARPVGNPEILERAGVDVALPLTALVLAGGQSTRLGRDKALVKVDGTSMIERVVRTVRSVCAEVLLLGGDAKELAFLGHPVLPDSALGEGPLFALRGGLEAMRHPWAFATSCDAPFLNPRLIEYLWKLRGVHQAVVPFTAMDRQPKPLCALYLKSCLPAIRKVLDGGERKMTAFYGGVRFLLVPEDNLRLVDPYLLSFHNVNTQEDLRIAEEIASKDDPRSP